MTTYDGVMFLNALDTILAGFHAQGDHSTWVLLDAANTLVRAAQARVYRRKPDFVGARLTAAAVEPVLEENPKFGALADILRDIAAASAPADGAAAATPADAGPVLIIVQEDRICQQLRDYLAAGGPAYMEARLRWYFRWKETLPQLTANMAQSAQRSWPAPASAAASGSASSSARGNSSSTSSTSAAGGGSTGGGGGGGGGRRRRGALIAAARSSHSHSGTGPSASSSTTSAGTSSLLAAESEALADLYGSCDDGPAGGGETAVRGDSHAHSAKRARKAARDGTRFRQPGMVPRGKRQAACCVYRACAAGGGADGCACGHSGRCCQARPPRSIRAPGRVPGTVGRGPGTVGRGPG